MQNSNHNNMDDKFAMNFNNFDTDALFNPAHIGGINLGLKRTAHDAGLDHREGMGLSSDDEDDDEDDATNIKKEGNINRRNMNHHHHPTSSSTTRGNVIQHHQTNIEEHHHHQNHQNQHHHQKQSVLPNGKKTKGRVKIKMEFIDNKLRRYTTFSKRKTGIMKKAYELSTLTGTQVMLLVASETGHVYTFATRKLQPMITSEAGKALIQTCLNSPDPPQSGGAPLQHDQRMSATGYEETELTYAVTEEEHKSPSMGSEEYLNGSSYSGSDCSSPPTPSVSPTPHDSYFPQSSSTSSSAQASDSIINSSNISMEKNSKGNYNNTNSGSSGIVCSSSSSSSSSVINSAGGSESQPGSHMGLNPTPFPLHLPPGLIFTSSVTGKSCESPLQVSSSSDTGRVYVSTTSVKEPVPAIVSIINTAGSTTSSTSTATSSKSTRMIQLVPVFTTTPSPKAFVTSNSSTNLPALTVRQAPSLTGSSVVVGSQGGSLMYSPTGSVVYSPNPSSLHEGGGGGSNPLLLNLPQGLHLPSDGDSQAGGRQLVGLSMKLASAAVLQQSAAAAAVVSAAAATSSSGSGGGSGISSLPSSVYSSNGFDITSESLPTDLSLHIKRENN